MMRSGCNLNHLLTWQSLNTQRLKSGCTHTHTRATYFRYCGHFWLGGRIKSFASLVLQSDLASWSPWPSCPSEPRPQLQTSVSRDGSPSSSSSCAVTWVWPPEGFKYALARSRRGDPERKKKTLFTKTLWWLLFNQQNHDSVGNFESHWRIQNAKLILNIPPQTATVKRKRNGCVPDTVVQLLSNTFPTQTCLVWTHPTYKNLLFLK